MAKKPKKRSADDDKAVQLSLDFETVKVMPVEPLPEQPLQPPSQAKCLSGNSLLQIIRLPTAEKPKRKRCYSPEYLKTLENWYRQSWGDVFYDEFPLDWTIQLLDPLLGWLRGKRARGSYWSGDYPLNIHRLEKDLVYLAALAINKKAQLFISVPISPISLGILTVAYYANRSREARDVFSTNHAVPSKSFVIWVRPQDNGQIQNLRIARASGKKLDLSERLICLPAHKFEESSRDNRLRVVMVRSLSEGIQLLQKSKFCSLVVLDDPSGRTYSSPSRYGQEAFELAKLCNAKAIPIIGIVPPWAMHSIEAREHSAEDNILLWAIDSAALRSYPIQPSPFAKSDIFHPIEESYQLLNKKCTVCVEAQVTIKTFSFDAENEEKIAGAFREASDLLIELTQGTELRNICVKGWEIWRDLSAPVLPFYLLWRNFLQSSLKQLETAVQRSGDQRALVLYQILNSLIQRLQKLPSNPFIQAIKALEDNTTVAIADIARAEALEHFLSEHQNIAKLKITTISELRGQEGNKLVILGQPKARYRDLLQTTFFHEVDVLLWEVLAKRAETWWSGLEVDSRAWQAKTWRSLTDQEFGGRYDYSYQPKSVQFVHVGKTRLHRAVDLSKLEESFSKINGSSLDSSLDSAAASNLSSHYLVRFEGNLSIRVSPNSEFLVLLSNCTQTVSVKDIGIGTRVVLFEGMNRDELFAQKAGLLEETRDNWLYHVQLQGWRELVKQCLEQSSSWAVCRQIFRDTGVSISETAVQYWMDGDDLLSLPREEKHFFWFLPSQAHSALTAFWQKANVLRDKRRQLGRVISACAQEGWKDRNSDKIVFQYQQIFITVGELRDTMQVVRVKAAPQLIQQKPEYPVNRLFRTGV